MTKAWIELRLDATAEGVDWVRSLLASIDYVGEVDVRPIEPAIDSWQFTMRIYRPKNDLQPYYSFDADRIIALLKPLERTGLTTAVQSATVTKSAFPAAPETRIGRFAIRRSASVDRSHPDEISLQLGESLTFGSGLHPATILSLRLVERHLEPEMAALDLGSGSGILSVAMAKLGARVVAIDNDPIAVEATEWAVQLNSVESQVRVCSGSLGQGSELGHWMNHHSISTASIAPAADFDLIVTNILARVHIALASDYQHALKPQGIVITAGYTIDFADEVDAALVAAGFEPIDREERHEWVAIAHRLRAA